MYSREGEELVEVVEPTDVADLRLALEEIELVQEEPNLEGDLGLELWHGDRVRCGSCQALCPRLTETTMSGGAIRVGQRGGSPAGCRRSCRGEAQECPSRSARRVLEQLPQLRKAKLDQAIQPLTELGLFGHKSHREASRLAQLNSGEGIAGPRHGNDLPSRVRLADGSVSR
jgi:hypothetical protein